MKRILVVLALTAGVLAAQPKGKLFIIGGGKIPDALVEQFVALAGGPKAAFLVIPMASAEPEKSAEAFAARLQKCGAADIRLLIAQKGETDSDSNLLKLKGVTGVFITGGDQSRLTEIFLGSKALQYIKKIYHSGGVIGGTSAGAAVMSKVMLTGNERRNKDSSNAYQSIVSENIETIEGFGFLETAVVDQHFIKRKRLNRLISAVLDRPDLLGIGIDESTAAIVTGNRLDVVGESAVMLFDASAASGRRKGESGVYSCGGLLTHLLQEGDSYDMKKRRFTGGKARE